MNCEDYFQNIFESIPDYGKIVLLISLIKKDKNLLECGFLKIDNNRLRKEFKTVLMDQNEENLDHNKYQEESIIEKILNK